MTNRAREGVPAPGVHRARADEAHDRDLDARRGCKGFDVDAVGSGDRHGAGHSSLSLTGLPISAAEAARARSFWTIEVLEVMSECLSCPAWLSDSETPDFLSHGALPVDTAFALCSEYNACAWLSGDWHSRKVWERGGVTVAQVGALCPTGFDNPGLTGYGSVWTFEDGRLTWVTSRPARAASTAPPEL